MFPVNGFMHVLTNTDPLLHRPLSSHKVRAIKYVELFCNEDKYSIYVQSCKDQIK